MISRKNVLHFSSELSEAKVIILGIPFESTRYGEMEGTRKAPFELRKYFDYYYSFDIDRNVDLYELPVYDAGNVIITTTKFEEAKKKVWKVIEKLRERNEEASFFFLGGDHLVTSMTAPKLKVKSLLSFDAHLDLLREAKEYEHATAMRKVFDSGIEVHVRGVRDADREEVEFAKKLDWKKGVEFEGSVDYLSFDSDVLDPVYASVVAPVACGFSPKEMIQVIGKVRYRHADLVEWLPSKNFSHVIKIFREILLGFFK